ncbi:alpha/beta hydrolase [Agromyces sp. SYSU K20354]|uniref:alpha/beta hydrolase n=1 Tax=Agromyces cavernae TaxID=2898659 RepID=UPI001E2D3940|nr:alpha/beta hydrolase [Agromyces cavernae]MCD2440906.1 alpha/beta hydrolase [Agromyces cavernae]
MGDGLTISGGGETTVATDELFVDAARLGAAAGVIDRWMSSAAALHAELDDAGLDGGTGWAEPAPADAMRRVERELGRCGDTAEELRSALIASAERYGWAERTIDGFWKAGGGLIAGLLGWVAAPVGIGLGVGLAANSAWRGLIGPTPLDQWITSNRGLLSDPTFVRVVRAAADSVDEFLAGVRGAPGSHAIGQFVGAPESASVLLALTALLGSKSLVDGPVSVTRANPGQGAPPGHPAAAPVRFVAAPTGVSDLADRVPSGEGPQIRIERYGQPDDPRWVVYVSGTVESSLVAGEEPFDHSSNVFGIADDSVIDALRMAGAESGAGERAVRQAMEEAGVAPGDPVMPVGHSGGGIIAAKVAADPELNVVGAVNLGGPTASAPTSEGVPVLSIEHDEDIVPAVGGFGQPSPERLTVSRSVLEEGREYDSALPAHELARYRETAALVDESEEARLVAFVELIGFTGGGPGEVSEWTARRDGFSSSTGAR